MMRYAAILAGALAVSAPASAGEKTGAPADFASAAEECIAALSADGDISGSLPTSGWREAGANPIGKRYTHEGSRVAIFTSAMMGSPSCVVDGYLKKGEREGLGEVIEASLSATYGDRLKVTRSPFGTSFVVGDVMAILSFETRSGGLSTRITAMSMAEQK